MAPPARAASSFGEVGVVMVATARELSRRGRKLDRLNAEVEEAIKIMRSRGASLHRTNREATTCWFLSPNGGAVSEAVAGSLIARPDMAAVGDSLLDDARLSQTWCLIEPA